MVRVVLKRLRAMFSAGRSDSQLDAEIREHLDRLADDHGRRGLSPVDARAAARRDFGGVDQVKEAYRSQRSFRVLDELAQDIRFALRMLRRSPVFSVPACLSLAIGIGAATAVFTIA